MESINTEVAAFTEFCESQYDKSAIPSLVEYVKIPNLSRAYDAGW